MGEGFAPLWPTTVHEGREGHHNPLGAYLQQEGEGGVIETIINSWVYRGGHILGGDRLGRGGRGSLLRALKEHVSQDGRNALV